MKKILNIFILLALVFQACDNDNFEEIHKESPDVRIKALVQDYSNILTSAKYGWKALYYPNEESGGAYNLLIKFDAKGNASIVSDMQGKKDTSLFKIKSEQELILGFDTYSQLHILADPINDIPGKGMGGDFEFLFKEISANKIVLKGKIGESEMILLPAEATTEKLIKDMSSFPKFLKNIPNAPFFREISVVGGVSNISFKYSENREVSLTYLNDEKEIVSENRKVYFTETGFSFNEAFSIGGKEIKDFAFNITSSLFDVVNSDIKGSITYSNAPAFEIKGVVDAFLSNNFYQVVEFSQPFYEVFLSIKNSIPGFESFQLYSSSGYFIGYNPSNKGDEWAGFAGITYGKVSEDLIVNTWTMNVIGGWWKKIYYAPNNAGSILVSLLTEPNGMYVVPDGKGFYLVSKAYPNYYFKVQ